MIPSKNNLELEERNKNAVKQYYFALDQNDLEGVFRLFSKDIDYNRCGFRIKGMEAFKAFFLNERTMRGKHTVKTMIAEENTVASRGTFRGKNAAGEEVYLQFAEFYFFDEEGLIFERSSYLAMGVDATK